MEAEKDNHLPETTNVDASKDDPAPQDDPNHHDQPPNNDADDAAAAAAPKDDDSATSPPLTPTEADQPKPGITTDQLDNINTDPDFAAGAVPDPDGQESPPPPSPPDSRELCQRIDDFISALSATKPDAPSSTLPDVPEIMKEFAFLVEAKIANFDSSDNPMKWAQLSAEDSSSFLEDAGRLTNLKISLSAFSSEPKYAASINRIGDIHQRAMSYLEDEFRSLLEDPTLPPDSDDINDNNDIDSKTSNEADQSTPQQEPESTGDDNFLGYSDDALSNLNRIAKTMISGGYEMECILVYIRARRAMLEETLHTQGFEKFSMDDVQKMQWELLEREIDSWNKTLKHFAAVIFPRERKLLEAVLSDDKAAIKDIFGGLSQSIMIQLLNFAEAVAMTKRSQEKLFKFLDLYETLREVSPSSLDNFFSVENGNELKTEASLTRTRLGEAMVCIFAEMENSIKRDTGRTPVPGGAVHPLTRYTMNYLTYACEYHATLEQVFREHQKIERAYSGAGSDYDYNNAAPDAQINHNNNNEQNHETTQSSPFCLQIRKVMDLLDAYLETRSKLYKDAALSSIFMMNNGRYILQKIKGSPEMNDMMGVVWCRKRSSDMRQYHNTYKRETWGRLLNSLSQEGLNVHGKVVKPVLKERFKSFNALFDEIHRTQSNWVVKDEQLQSELRVSISLLVIPAYRTFLARYSPTFTPGRQTEKYVKYQPEDIEAHIDELFDGNANATPTPTGRRWG
ncbi:exocyst complex component EXO70B1-like [Diospyros lotus]|uniref:exocyst complex component EXO70B1-like n=1 Tax=Diospyros lotus TaxID=55363 RepID=UPI00224F7FBF|nr:exocyst complex component EXO70B1-like [Diospyros lotus]